MSGSAPVRPVKKYIARFLAYWSGLFHRTILQIAELESEFAREEARKHREGKALEKTASAGK